MSKEIPNKRYTGRFKQSQQMLTDKGIQQSKTKGLATRFTQAVSPFGCLI